MKIRRMLAAALALLTVASVSGCAISAALEEEGGFKFNSTQVSAEQEIGEIKLHDMSATPEWFNGISAPAIFTDYTGTPYETVEGDLYVSPDGNDETGDGSKENPYATFEKAKNAVREIKAAGKLPKGTFTVVFMPGEYRISEGLVFTEEDSGTEDCRIIYAAYDAREVVFKGSKKLNASDFTAVGEDIKAILPDASKDKVLMVDLKKYGITSDQLHIYGIGQESWMDQYDPSYVGINVQFYFNRQAFDLARYPNGDAFLTTDSIVNAGDPVSKTPGVFKMSAADTNRVKSWHSTDGVWVVGRFFVDWATMSSAVSFNLDERTASFDLNCFHNPLSSSLYRFYNVLDELDIPGEWYLDRENCILYMYPTGDMADAELEMVVDFDDTMISGEFITDVTFMGITFMGGRDSGMLIYDCEDIYVDRCKFYGFGGDYACEIGGYNNVIIECEAHYNGDNGFSIFGGEKATLKPGNNLIENCYATHWGLSVHTFSVGISVGGFNSTMRYCEAAYSEGNALALAQGNSVAEYNTFHDCSTWATDCGTLYVGSSLMGCPNNQLRYNLFYNIGTELGQCGGVFWDHGHGSQRIYGNLFVNITGHGLTVGGGRNNTFMNNIIVNVGRDAIYYSQALYDSYHWYGITNNNNDDAAIGGGYMWNNYKGVPHTDVWFETIPYLIHVADDASDIYSPHFLFNPTMSLIINNVIIDERNSIGRIFPQTRQYSIVRDNYTGIFDALETVFVDAENGDYRIREDAPIYDVVGDFKDIPYHLIGRK